MFVCLFVFAHIQTVIAVCWGGWVLTESMTVFYQPLHLASHFKIVFWWLILFITDANKRALWLCDCEYTIPNVSARPDCQAEALCFRPVCLSFCPFVQTCERGVLKTNEPISMLTDTSGLHSTGMKQSTLGSEGQGHMRPNFSHMLYSFFSF